VTHAIPALTPPTRQQPIRRRARERGEREERPVSLGKRTRTHRSVQSETDGAVTTLRARGARVCERVRTRAPVKHDVTQAPSG
jgi:hypothetical protein